MNKATIPCSVAILTLNSSDTLRRCLDSVKDFAEIVICDGNSTDDTLDIAREYGCKIIKQYETDEPNQSCVRDKANVRNKALDASTFDWHIYLDSDDALSKGVVEEVRTLLAGEPTPHLVYRMPLIIILGGTRRIEHSSNYPYKQLRLFNKKTGARFTGRVHERIKFDPSHTIGDLGGYYENHWPMRRVENIFKHMRLYAEWEVEEWRPRSAGAFFAALVERLRSAARVVIVSSWNYLRWGFRTSMPPRVELARLYYQLYLLYLICKKQFFSAPSEK